MAGTPENELDHGSHQPCYPPPAPLPQPPQQGIVIQLTGTEGEWDSLEDSGLIFTLDGEADGPSVFSPKEKSKPKDGQPEKPNGHHSSASHVSAPPSTPGPLGDLSISAPCYLSPHSSSSTVTVAPDPLTSLVKSSSTEIDSKEASSLKPRPLLSLVKSISTEISRSEPEVSQSKSDSRLNLHLWRQLTQPKGRIGDSRTAPPSPSSLSPSEPKVGFFKAELEDTRRKLSEAMQEPFSMFSKIMDESMGSPKLQRATWSSDSSSNKGACGQKSGEAVVTEAHGRSSKTMECDCLSVSDTPVRQSRWDPLRPCHSAELSGKLEMCTRDDLVQVVEVDCGEWPHGLQGDLVSVHPSPPVPGMWLLCVAMLSYCYFILPLPSYVSGLALGVVCGFMSGLLLVLLLTPRHLTHPHRSVLTQDEQHQSHFLGREHREPGVLKGWMNEMHAYDPETYHPSLTHSVYVTLEGSCLRLEYPSNNIPRRATFVKPPHETVFVRSRCYQLANSKVYLLPTALARKRVWNKKYPICIMLAKGQDGKEEDAAQESDEEEPRPYRKTPQSVLPVILYLFSRTGREKEEWFQHFLSASIIKDEESHSICGSRLDVSGLGECSPSARAQCTGGSSRGSAEDIPSLLHLRDLAGSMKEKILLDYSTYMSHFISTESRSPLPSPCHTAEGSPTAQKEFFCECSGIHGEPQPIWINALIGRIFWDFLREKYWSDQVAHKIQKKLSKIKLPYFMNELTLTELDMGTSMPQVISTSKPSVNHRGLWLELQVVYTGCLQMTLETKMNLYKLGKECGLETDCVSEMDSMVSRPRLCVLADSDEESSSAGSSDGEELPTSEPQGNLGENSAPPGTESHGGGSTSRRILRFVDKIAKSKYFQKATENEYIKKKIKEMSNTPLLLTVEVQELSGTLAVNIPPPSTDRIWYSFCVPPRLDLHVRPKLGEREVTFTHVTEWIERKLQNEFQKVFVMPNMDDIYLPLMHSGLDNPPASQHSSTESLHSLDSLEKPVQENAA